MKPTLHRAVMSFLPELTPSQALQVAAKITQHQCVPEQFTLRLNELLLVN